MNAPRGPKFLTAEWRHLLMLNYDVDPAILKPLVPDGTELDSFGGRTLVSMVGFLFLKTRLLGVPIPFHSDFEEVNLRFYVRRKDGADWRRGVVFVKEIVPKWAVATVARLTYGERYVRAPMRHQISDSGGAESPDGATIAFEWETDRRWNRLSGAAKGDWFLPTSGSLEEFITEHYWGYVTRRDGATVEYHVHHPQWRVATLGETSFDCDVAPLYGAAFTEPLAAAPTSAFLAEGSSVSVHWGARIAKSG